MSTMNNMNQFLPRKCHLLEAIALETAALSQKLHHRFAVHQKHRGIESQQKSYQQAYAGILNKNVCPVSNVKHFIFRCPKFIELSIIMIKYKK